MANQTTNNNNQRKLEEAERMGLNVIGNIYDVETASVEKFIKLLFETAGVDGVLNPVVRINKEGSGSDIGVTCILCINSNSKNIRNTNKQQFGNTEKQISPVFLNNGKKDKFKPDKTLATLLVKTARFIDDSNENNPRFRIEVGYKAKNIKVLTVQLDALRILALMAGVDTNTHKIQVMFCKNIGNNNGVIKFATVKRTPGSSMEDIIKNSILKNLRK
ncbi:MAG TPA: hypothetical protein DCE23_01980 [Firmicutes bacterium]|nr:hypothetical protein [Bacillota bacterium]